MRKARSWDPDESADTCSGEMCDRRFTLLVRRHHCRACGGVFCSVCSSKRRQFIGLGNHMERICDGCCALIDAQEFRQRYTSDCVVSAAITIATVAASASKRHEAEQPYLCCICYGRPITEECSNCKIKCCHKCLESHEHKCKKNSSGYRVRVLIHEARNCCTTAITNPMLSVIICSDLETVKTTTMERAYSPYFGEEFTIRIRDYNDNLFFKVVNDGVIANSIVGRACIPVSTITGSELKGVWLELLPMSNPTEAHQSKLLNSGNRPNAMKKPKPPLGWICVSVAAGTDTMLPNQPAFPAAIYFEEPLPEPPCGEFNTNEFMSHVNRLLLLWHERFPILLVLLSTTSDFFKIVCVIPCWAFIVYFAELWEVPFLFWGTVFANGIMGSGGHLLYLRNLPVYEEDSTTQNKNVLQSAYQVALEGPVVLRRVQSFLSLAASCFERIRLIFTFIDPSVSSVVAFVIFSMCTVISLILYLFHIRLIILVIGCVIILACDENTSDDKLSRKLLRYVGFYSLLHALENLWGHIPDMLRLEHTYIALWQRSDDPPSVHHATVRRSESLNHRCDNLIPRRRESMKL